MIRPAKSSNFDERTEFLESHWSSVHEVMKLAEKPDGDERVVVLADLNDYSGSNFAGCCTVFAHDILRVDGAFIAHFSKTTLVNLLDIIWPELKNVIEALRSDDWGRRRWVLVISRDGAQLRGASV